MNYQISEAVAVLERTPNVLRAMLAGLPDVWTSVNEGPGTWTPYEVVGHLIHGERADWIPRVRHFLEFGETRPFPPFDREAMLREPPGQTLETLLDTFDALRRESLKDLAALALGDADLTRRSLHPALGVVTLNQHLASWVAHDLTHIAQIVRTMAVQYRDEVGPWRAYLSILGARKTE